MGADFKTDIEQGRKNDATNGVWRSIDIGPSGLQQ